jgi:hypothetical protein
VDPVGLNPPTKRIKKKAKQETSKKQTEEEVEEMSSPDTSVTSGDLYDVESLKMVLLLKYS